MNLWYGHPKTSVLLVDTPLPEGEWTNLQPYGGRGWCRMEQRASAIKHAAHSSFCRRHNQRLNLLPSQLQWRKVRRDRLA